MRVHILAVGSELLTPFFKDSDSLYLTRRLNDMGFEVAFRAVVGDELPDLVRALSHSLASADLVLVSGGLGPTDDDRTREAAAQALGRPLILDEGALARLEEWVRRRGRTMPPSNLRQAYVVEGAEVLVNERGTAPGLWIADAGRTLVLLPGPPGELQPMCEAGVWPRLAGDRRGFMTRIVLKTTGRTESELETRIAGLYPKDAGRRLTVLSQPGQVELHVSAYSGTEASEAERKARALAEEIKLLLGDHLFSDDGAELEEVVGRLLIPARLSLAAAESCTGGLLGHRITSVPGSSAYFLEGFVTYSNRAKIDRLGVPEETIAALGAVSPETARAMAEGARARSGADLALAVTGIAGPSGGTEEKPVGLVFIALASVDGIEVVRNRFFGDRSRVIFQSSQKALDMLRRHLLGKAAS
jgi:nicotinamide-nucleotide amidase